jgi:hypothetical protein
VSYRTDEQVTAFKTEIRDRVIRHLGKEARTNLEDVVDDYMKDALRTIGRAHTWTWRRLAPEILLAANTAATQKDIPSYVDQYAEVQLYQEHDEDSLPLAYIAPAEWLRRDCQDLTAQALIEAYTVMDDDFYFSPPVSSTGIAVMLFAHIAPSQLDDSGTIKGIWRRVPDSFMYCIEVGALAEMDLLDENLAHKWAEKHEKELQRLIQLDETSYSEGGK